MIHELLPAEIGISVSYPLPGTVFYDRVKSELREKTNWTDSDELALMFKNRYQPAFYKQLHRYVHKSYRKHLALNMIRQAISHPMDMNRRTIKKAFSVLYYMPTAFIEKIKLKQLEKN